MANSCGCAATLQSALNNSHLSQHPTSTCLLANSCGCADRLQSALNNSHLSQHPTVHLSLHTALDWQNKRLSRNTSYPRRRMRDRALLRYSETGGMKQDRCHLRSRQCHHPAGVHCGENPCPPRRTCNGGLNESWRRRIPNMRWIDRLNGSRQRRNGARKLNPGQDRRADFRSKRGCSSSARNRRTRER